MTKEIVTANNLALTFASNHLRVNTSNLNTMTIHDPAFNRVPRGGSTKYSYHQIPSDLAPYSLVDVHVRNRDEEEAVPSTVSAMDVKPVISDIGDRYMGAVKANFLYSSVPNPELRANTSINLYTASPLGSIELERTIDAFGDATNGLITIRSDAAAALRQPEGEHEYGFSPRLVISENGAQLTTSSNKTVGQFTFDKLKDKLGIEVTFKNGHEYTDFRVKLHSGNPAGDVTISAILSLDKTPDEHAVLDMLNGSKKFIFNPQVELLTNDVTFSTRRAEDSPISIT